MNYLIYLGLLVALYVCAMLYLTRKPKESKELPLNHIQENMEYSLAQWERDIFNQKSCRHSAFGSCVSMCPQCTNYGFIAFLEDGQRKYRLCKYCGFGQNVGGKPYQCYWELCPNCYAEDRPLKSSGKVADSKESGIRLTQFPGHLCPRCGTTMKVRNDYYKIFIPIMQEIYAIHQYEREV